MCALSLLGTTKHTECCTFLVFCWFAAMFVFLESSLTILVTALNFQFLFTEHVVISETNR